MKRALPDQGVCRRDFLKLLGVLAAGSSGVLAACGSRQPLRVASHVWPGYEFMFVARDQGWLDRKDATLISTGSATESLQYLASGEVEAAAITLDEVLLALQRGIPLTVVLLFNISAGADAVLAKPAIASLAELRGARIGVEVTALGQLMLRKLLEKAGLGLQEVQVVSLKADEHLSAWRQGKLDAVICYEPVVSVIEEGGWRRLFDSVDIPDTIFDVLAVRREALSAYSSQLRGLIQAHFKAQYAWKTNPVDTAYRMAKRLNLRAEQIPGLYRGIELPDIDYNRHMLGSASPKLLASARQIAAIMGTPPDLVDAALFQARYLD